MIDPRNPDYVCTPASAQRPEFGYAPADESARPLVSIITPFFNTGRVFHETARTVFGQSLQQWEWLIINDASTDAEALRTLGEYRNRDARIRVIDQATNGGPAAARNRGFREACTEFVYQLDSDDLLEPTALEKCRWYLEAHPRCAFVRGMSVGFERQQYLWTRGFNQGRAFLDENLATIMVMIRRSVYLAVGGSDESLRDGMEDWEFWLRCADRGHWGADIPEFLDWYRRRDCHGDRWKELADAERRGQFRQTLLKRFPGLVSGAFPAPPMNLDPPMSPPTNGIPDVAPLRKVKRRLLMIVPWLRMGGADKFNLDLVRQLTERGWEVTIATTLSAPSAWGPDFARHTPDIFFLHTFLRRIDYPAFLRNLIRTRQPDVVMVSNSELGYQLLPYLRANCPEPAYVDYCHMEEENWKNGGYPRYAIGAQELLDLNIVASQHLKRWMTARGADPARIDVAYINVAADAWKPDERVRNATRQRLNLAPDTAVILYAGRLCPQKRPLVFGQTMRALLRENPAFITLVAGDGEDGPALREYVERNGLTSHVRFLGEIALADMPTYFQACDIFFLPSEWEGIALSIYEAMACGRAVVGADVGGQRELVIDGCGYLIPRTDEQTEIRGYVEKLSALIQRPELRREIGAAARRRVSENFELSAMGERMVALLQRAVELRANHPRPAVGLGVGRETATHAIEFARMSDNLDELWRLHVAAKHTNGVMPTATPVIDERTLAVGELCLIENSRFWRTLQQLKRATPYSFWARWRFGPHWDDLDPAEDPRERLARIKQSNAYRLIQAAKSTPFYRWYARRKYGAVTTHTLGSAITPQKGL